MEIAIQYKLSTFLTHLAAYGNAAAERAPIQIQVLIYQAVLAGNYGIWQTARFPPLFHRRKAQPADSVTWQPRACFATAVLL